MNFFYTDKDGEVVGPVTRERLQLLVDGDHLPSTTQVCYEGSQEWQPINTYLHQTARPPSKSQISGANPSAKPTAKSVSPAGFFAAVFLAIIVSGGSLMAVWHFFIRDKQSPAPTNQHVNASQQQTPTPATATSTATTTASPNPSQILNQNDPAAIRQQFVATINQAITAAQPGLKQPVIRKFSGGDTVTIRAEYTGKLSYDIEKTDSIVTPFLGSVSWIMRWHANDQLRYSAMTFDAHYAYQDGRWVFKDLVLNFDGKKGGGDEFVHLFR